MNGELGNKGLEGHEAAGKQLAQNLTNPATAKDARRQMRKDASDEFWAVLFLLALLVGGLALIFLL